MKINFFLLFLALVICGLISFGLYNTYDDRCFYSIATGGVAFLMLGTALALRMPESPRSGVLVRVVSSIFFVVMLIMDILFTCRGIGSTAFIVVNGIMLCVWAALVYGLGRAKQ